jgi:protein phosphatase methylesterase 1
VAARRRETDAIAGVVVLDVAEDTVIGSFKFLEEVVGRWPTAFASPEDYVRWTVGMRRPSSSHSATVSTADHLVADAYGRFRMKFDLLEWKDSWVDWFRGFDSTFISLSVPSLLIMAHYDNLDTSLAVGHMQGRFECQIMSSPLRSHFMQEDSPDELFNMLLTFLRKRGFISMDIYNELVVAGRRNRIFV